MIVILNSLTFPTLQASLETLAVRYDSGVGLDLHALTENGMEYWPETIGQELLSRKQAGKQHIVLSGIFYTPAALKALRSHLDRYDNEIYAFRLHFGPGALAQTDTAFQVAYADWDKKQASGAQLGDMGYAMGFDSFEPEQIVKAVWDDIHEPLELVEYSSRWPIMFSQEKAELENALQGLGGEIEHIGSTAIPEMPAKPIIDILIIVENLKDAWKCTRPLQTRGYAFIDYPQNTTRRFFRKGKPRSRHIHIVERGSAPHRDHINFRDALLTDESLRQEYLQLKQDAMGEFKHRRALYGEKKGTLIQKALAQFIEQEQAWTKTV